MNKWLTPLVFALLVFCGAPAANAQGQMQRRGPAAERVEAFKKIRLMEALKLDEEASIRFFARYNKHQDEMKSLGEERNGLIDQLQSLGRSKAGDADYEKVIQELTALESRILDARKKFIGDLKEVFTAKQVADYIVFERNFNQNLRDLMREMTQERRGFQGSPR